MGCCVGANKNISKNIDILLNPEELINIIKNDESLNVNDQMTNVQIKQKTGKEEIKKEKSENNSPNIQENQKDSNDKDKKQSVFSKTQNQNQNRSSNSKDKENKDKNSLKVNKNRAIKKGSQNIYSAMRKLKLLSLEELDQKKNFFQ